MGLKSSAPKTQIVINRAIAETRLALLDGGRLVEFYRTSHFEERKVARLKEIYLGRVRTIDSALNAAFVDLGLPQDGFLRAEDAAPLPNISEKPKPEKLKVAERLHEGQQVLVQVETEATSEKGPRLRTDIALAGRHLVFFPLSSGIKVSARIKPQEKADALAAAFRNLLRDTGISANGGYIIRTKHNEFDAATITRELTKITDRWNAMSARAKAGKAPAKLTKPKDWALEVLERLSLTEPLEIICDDTHLRTTLKNWIADASLPQTTLATHTDVQPIFEALGIEDQLETARDRYVPLPGGGELVIDETEALTVIDINSARTDTRGRLPTAGESAFRTNSEAADEIARQLRLRAIGGLVVIDFIHMHKGQDDNKVVARLRRALRADPCPTEVGEMSRFGLVELTRKRERSPLSADYRAPATAPQPSLSACAFELFRAIEAELRRAPAVSLTVTIGPDLQTWLKASGAGQWRQFRDRLAADVALDTKAGLARHQFHLSRL